MPTPRPSALALPVLVLVAACGGGGGGGGGGGPGSQGTTVDLVRDRHGVPHVYSTDDEAAYHGLGFACAEDRFLQMSFLRLVIHGRVAEFFGADDGDGSLRHVLHDVRMRIFGYRRLASRLLAGLDPRTRLLLEAYADGVNAWLADPGAVLHPLFAVHGLPVEPWTAEDSIAIWLRIGRFFGNAEPLNEADLAHQYEALEPVLGHDAAVAALFPNTVFDEEAAAVQRSDVPLAVQNAIFAYAAQLGLDDGFAGSYTDPTLHFSHAWAVSGARTTTGRAVLFGDPRLRLHVPSSLWEASVSGASFSVRGVTVPGSPNFLVGSNGRVAWSVTALGMDQADLFEITTDPVGHPGQYLLDGQWLDFAVEEVETVPVLGGPDAAALYRETVWGPVVTQFQGDDSLVADAAPGEEFAVRWVAREVADGGGAAEAGFVAMTAAASADELRRALGGWTYPSVNCVFADDAGRVGFTVVGALPVRDPAAPLGGSGAQDGGSTARDWLDLVPPDLLPWVIDPAGGFAYSANHLPVGGWYPIPLVRNGGHSPRSRRLLERLEHLAPATTPDEVASVHQDAVWGVARDIARLGLHLRDVQGFALAPNAQSALALLGPWADTGGDGPAVLDELGDGVLSTARPTASALARWTGFVPFRDMGPGGPIDPALVAQYGAGDSGLAYFLRELVRRIEVDPAATLGAAEAAAIDHMLVEGWLEAQGRLGPPSGWGSWFQTSHLQRDLPRHVDLENFDVLDPGHLVPTAPIQASFAETILSQHQQAYSQRVELVPGDPDTARSLLPLGQSEQEGSPHFTGQQADWEASPQTLKASPVTRAEVEAQAGPTTVRVLTLPGE